MKKLFSNVGGNQFRLLTESVIHSYDRPAGADLVREGLKKVFSAANGEISYQRLSNVGLGYIKDVTQAVKCALREAKELAPEFGYKDNESEEKFVKEKPSHEESDMSNPEESAEVKIANEILHLTSKIVTKVTPEQQSPVTQIQALAKKLLEIHKK